MYARIILCIVIVSSLLCSCASLPTDYGIVAGNSRAAGQLEATISSLDRAVVGSRERIGEVISASRRIEDGIERLEYLFGCYEHEVIELQREIEVIRAQAQDGYYHNISDEPAYSPVLWNKDSVASP